MQEKISNIQTSRDALLRRIGRNVVNFQYLEEVLRSMIPSLANEGTLTNFHSNLTLATRKQKKASLGSLAGTFLGGIFYKPKADDWDTKYSPTEISMRVEFQIETTPEHAAERKRSLLKLVSQRNRLVHQDVLGVDLESDEQCEILSAQLDEQNDQIREQLQYFTTMRKTQREAYAELVKLMQSDEFLSVLFGERGTDENKAQQD